MRSIRSVLHSLKPQKRVLIIGSAFVDMVINVQEMPRAGADVEGDYRCTTVGGCSFNVADVLYKARPSVRELHARGRGPVRRPRRAGPHGARLSRAPRGGEGDNGWCLSLADASGERTFISMFGLELRMKPDWFERFDIESFDYFYVSATRPRAKTAASSSRPSPASAQTPSWCSIRVPACTSCRASASRTSAASAASSPSTPTRPSS